MLLRVLPALYEQRPQPILARLRDLVAPMAQLDPPEQLHLLRLLHTVARKRELGVNHSRGISLPLLCVSRARGGRNPTVRGTAFLP